MASQWEVLMETVPQKQRVLFALPVATSPDRDYACPAVEALRRQLPQGDAMAPMDGPQLVKTKQVLEDLAAVGELRGDYVMALQAAGELMGIMARHNQQAQAWKARLLAARLLTMTYRTQAASVLLRELRGELREDCSLAGLEGLVRLVEAEGEARCWRFERAMELLQGVGQEQPRGRGRGGYVEGILALAWMKRAEAMCLRVMGCVEVEKNMGAARRAAGGAVAAAKRVVGGRAGVGLTLRAEMAVAIAERVESGVESGCEALLRMTNPTGEGISLEWCAKRYLQLCWRLAELGKPVEAMKAVGRVTRGMLGQFGPNSTQALELQFISASVYRQQGLYQHAEALMRAAWETAQRVFPWPHPCHSSILLSTAELLLLSRNPSRAITVAQQARTASVMLPSGPSPRWLLCYLLTRAASHLLIGNQAGIYAAMKRYNRVLVATVGSPAVASLTAAAHRGMAKCLHAKGRVREAVTHLEMALKVKGLPIYMRPPSLRSLAALLWVAGRRERAVEMMQEAVTLYRTMHSHGPEQALVDLRNLAQMHAQLGHYVKAVKCLKKDYLPQVSDRVSHFLVCDLRLNYLSLTDRASAVSQFRRLASRVAQELGSDHPMTIGFQNKLLSLDRLAASTVQQNSSTVQSSSSSTSLDTTPALQVPSPFHSNENLSTSSTSIRTPTPSVSSPLQNSLYDDGPQFNQLLEDVGLSAYKEQLLRDGANLQTIGFVTAEDLVEYGIPKFTARKIVTSISESLEQSKHRRFD